MEKLSRDDQEQLDYVNAWSQMKQKKDKEKHERRQKRDICLKCAKYHIKRAYIELKQYFKLLLNLK